MALSFVQRVIGIPNNRTINGTIVTGAAGAVSSIVGGGFTVAKIGTGAYRITLSDPPRAFAAVFFSIGKSAAAAYQVQQAAYGPGNAYVDILTTTAGAASDFVSGNISFSFVGAY